jgi:hypothetical protein
MSVSLFRHAMNQEAKYLPYIFEGGHWADEEKALITVAIKPHVPERVYPTFNEWHFFKLEPGRFKRYMVTRATYERGSYYETIEEVILEIEENYLQ